MPSKDRYSDPELRDQVKEEIHNSDKGGEPGQWSARKAQMMAQEYKRRGGGYNTDKSDKDESQRNLDQWTEEEWQTKEGSAHAKKEDGTEKRYLPKKAWEQMSTAEKKETDEKKQKESKQGRQYVENTDKAEQSRKQTSKKGNGRDAEADSDDDEGDYEEAENGRQKAGIKSEEGMNGKKQTNCKNKANGKAGDDDEDADDVPGSDEAEMEEYADDGEADGENEGGRDESADESADETNRSDYSAENARAGQKRKGELRRPNESSTNKKRKDNSSKRNTKSSGATVGSKHMDATEPGPRGSADRLPKEGQEIQWKALPGYVDGMVEEILTHDRNVDGKSVKASENDPKIVLKSNKSGKICVHKPEACFYE